MFDLCRFGRFGGNAFFQSTLTPHISAAVLTAIYKLSMGPYINGSAVRTSKIKRTVSILISCEI